jgi:hypothetical protein
MALGIFLFTILLQFIQIRYMPRLVAIFILCFLLQYSACCRYSIPLFRSQVRITTPSLKTSSFLLSLRV